MKEKSLQEVADHFIRQAIEFERLSPRMISNYQMHLVGSPLPFVHIGLIRYLKSMGVSEPRTNDLCSLFVADYWEFLIQHYGAIQAACALKILRTFWRWCCEMKYVQGPMPADLRYGNPRVEHQFRVKIALRQSD